MAVSYQRGTRLRLAACLRRRLPWDVAWDRSVELPPNEDWLDSLDGEPSPFEVMHDEMKRNYEAALRGEPLGGTTFEVLLAIGGV